MATVKRAAIRFASEYAESIDCHDRGLRDASILAAQVNLAETTTPVYSRIKNHILLAALKSDKTEANEHRAAAEDDMHTLEALVHTLQSGCAASKKGRRMLALLNSDIRELGKIIKKNASGGVSGKLPKYVRIIHDCVEPTGDGHSLIFRIAEDHYELSVEECLVPGAKSPSRMIKDVEALRFELKEVRQSKTALDKETKELKARIAPIKESLDGWKRWFWVALSVCIVMLLCAFPEKKDSRALVQINTEPRWRQAVDLAGYILDIPGFNREERRRFGRGYWD